MTVGLWVACSARKGRPIKPAVTREVYFSFFFQTGSEAAHTISIPAASSGGLRQMEHSVAAWSLPRAYAALEVISLSD